MLEFIYTTDLHGNIPAYESILKTAIDYDIKIIHLGADLLPKGPGIIEIQKKFIKSYLKDFYDRCKLNNIKVLAFFGNDDIYTRKKYFRDFGSLLDENSIKINEYNFKAYPFVQDYKFGLKTACKWDSKDWRCPDEYIHDPVDIDDKNQFNIINDTNKYFLSKGTIEQDLNNIETEDNTIIAIHQPPYGLSLDVCQDSRRVGSKAVYNWIEKTQPLLVLCGHIHENYNMTKIYKKIILITL